MTTQEKYKAIKTRYKLTNAEIGRMFGYKSGTSFAHSTRKDLVVAGVVVIVEKVRGETK